MSQADLFGSTAEPGVGEPLASRLRPRTFAELVGQRRAVDVLKRLAESGNLPSLVLWGPPGSGKTTLAHLLATATESRFVSLSAVTAGVADLRRVVAEAREARRVGRRTVLFIDELHRFNKAQQDAILPHVEDGTVTLIGATTENPSFEVISPLLSRSRVFRLEALTDADLDGVLARGLIQLQVEASEDARAALVAGARGDARVLLNALEVAAALAAGEAIQVAHVEQALQRGHLLYDRAGDQHYDIVSALIKSIRGSDADAAVYWLARMLEAGEDPMFVARRLVILASEDVGLADPMALPVAVAAQQAAHFVGLPEALFPLTQAALYLARAPKSRAVADAYSAAGAAVKRTGNLPVPLHLRNPVTGLMRSLGYGEGEGAFLPPELEGERFTEPRTLRDDE